MNFEVENAKEEDIEFILKGIKDVCRIEKQIPEDRRVLIKKTREALLKKQIRVAKISGNTVGFIQFSFSRRSPYGMDYGTWTRRFAWMEWLYVDSSVRGKGIGSVLHGDLIKICKKKNVTEILLDVFDVNDKAIEFYLKRKFNNVIHIMSHRLK